MAASGPQNGRRGLERVIGHFKQLSLNKFFDPSTPSMRKGSDGEKKMEKMEKNGKKKKIMVKIAVHYRRCQSPA